MKDKFVISILPDKKFNMKITEDNIYTGRIMKCTSYRSKYVHDEEFIKNAILVKINCGIINIFIPLDKFDLKQLRKSIHFLESGTINIHIEDGEFIMLDNPLTTGMMFVDSNSVKKLIGISNDNSSKQYDKIKRFVREANKKGE